MKTVFKNRKFKKFFKILIFSILLWYWILFLWFSYMVLVSEANINDIFSCDCISIFKNRPSEISKEIVVDTSLLDFNGGITTLTSNLIEKIAHRKPEWRFNLLLEKPNPKILKFKNLKNVRFIKVKLHWYATQNIIFNLLNFSTFGLAKDKLMQLTFYDNVFLDKNVDLFWNPDGGDNINDFSVNKITTIHDIKAIETPENFFWKRHIQNRNLENIQSSKKIITVSDFSKSRICDVYKVPEDFIRVIPIRLANRLPRKFSAAKIQSTLEKFKILPHEYLIFTSQYYPNKNHKRLIQAFSKFIENPENKNYKNLKLVLVGSMEYSRGEIEKFAAEYNSEKNIIFTGVVDNNELQILLSQSLCFVHPSLYEGFGMPIIEAMASGTPVTCSNASSLPEVADDAALYFDPYDTDSIEESISEMVKNPQLRNYFIEKGYARAKEFENSDAMIDEYIKVFEEVMASR